MNNQVLRTPLLILTWNTIKQRRRVWDFKDKWCAKLEILSNRTGLWKRIFFVSSFDILLGNGLCEEGFRLECLTNNGSLLRSSFSR